MRSSDSDYRMLLDAGLSHEEAERLAADRMAQQRPVMNRTGIYNALIIEGVVVLLCLVVWLAWWSATP